MRDFVASLLRMVNLKPDYFIEQFNSEVERRDVILDLLHPGQQNGEVELRGGIIKNFSLENIQTNLAHDQDLAANLQESFYTSDPLVRMQISDAVIKGLRS